MDLENEDYLDFTRCATNNQLTYMVIGGFAMYLNGIRRNTEDFDVWIQPTHENGQLFIDTLLCMGFTIDELDQLTQHDFQEPIVFGLLGTIDVMTRVHKNLDFEACYSRSRTYVDPRGIEVHFLHLNDLRQSKVWARRDQDLRDIIQIDDFIKEREDRKDTDKRF
ncbi:MAG: hypothetical protein LH609_06750 [Rudanella sp.]|nr:hypothetical protein [Rudanella sp.]